MKKNVVFVNMLARLNTKEPLKKREYVPNGWNLND